MSSNLTDEMDKIIQEKLGGYVEEPSPDLFDSIVSGRKQSGQNNVLTKILLAIAGAAIILFLLYKLLSQQDHSSGSLLYPALNEQNLLTSTPDHNSVYPAVNRQAAPAYKNFWAHMDGRIFSRNYAADYATGNTTSINPQYAARNMAGKARGKNNSIAHTQARPAAATRKTDPAKGSLSQKAPADEVQTLKAMFTYLVDSNGHVSFFNQSDEIGTTVSYEWFFSDGNKSYSSNADHHFIANGTYHVCLSISNELGAYDSYCEDVYISNAPIRKNLIGKVNAGHNAPDKGTVYLIRFDSSSMVPYMIDSNRLDELGYFSFNNLPDGYYIIRATLDTRSMYYNEYIPTYLGQTLVWNNARRYATYGLGHHGNSEMLVINLLPLSPRERGNEQVNGELPPSNNPLDKMLILYDEQGRPISYGYVDPGGKYSFTDVPPGKYTVYDPRTGKYVSYDVGKGNPTPPPAPKPSEGENSSGTPSEAGSGSPGNLQAYPNACNEELTVEFDNPTLSKVTIKVVNPVNYSIPLTQEVRKPSAHQKVFLYPGMLPNGLYILMVEFADGSAPLTTNILVKH